MLGPLLVVTFVLCQFLASGEGAKFLEVYLLIDQKAVDNYTQSGLTASAAEAQAWNDAEYFMSETSKILKDAVGLEIRLRQMEFLRKDIYSSVIQETRVNKDTALTSFRTYLGSENSHASLHYDVAVLFTGYDLLDAQDITGSGVAGYATLGATCSATAAAVVEFYGTYKTVFVNAHELGHVLGLNHDSSTVCANEGGYIMCPSLASAITSTTFDFSSTSLDNLRTNIADYGCLDQTSSDSKTPNETAPNELLDPFTMCKRAVYSDDSYVCTGTSYYKNQVASGDIICQAIYCHIPGTSGTCRRVLPTEGMVCAAGKRCNMGSCVDAPSDMPTPSGLINDCLFGDNPFNYNGQDTTCADQISDELGAGRCYNTFIKNSCCATCRAYENPDSPGCEYGDSASWCGSYRPNQICPIESNRKNCCETCKDYNKRKREATDPVDVIEQDLEDPAADLIVGNLLQPEP